jgi:hypothetical protein
VRQITLDVAVCAMTGVQETVLNGNNGVHAYTVVATTALLIRLGPRNGRTCPGVEERLLCRRRGHQYCDLWLKGDRVGI